MMDHKKNQQSNKYAFFESILFFLFFDATIIKSFFLTFYRRKYNENKVNLFWDGKEVLKQQTKNSAEQLNTAKFLSLFSQYFSHIWFDVYFFPHFSSDSGMYRFCDDIFECLDHSVWWIDDCLTTFSIGFDYKIPFHQLRLWIFLLLSARFDWNHQMKPNQVKNSDDTIIETHSHFKVEK